MLDTSPRTGAPLRVSDLVPLRRMLGAHSMVIRVNPDATLVPFEIMPALFYGRSIRQLLTEHVKAEFAEACQAVIANLAPLAFRAEGFDETDEVMITPILGNDDDSCRFLVCWARATEAERPYAVGETAIVWEDLRIADVTTLYRSVGDTAAQTIEASPWWAPPGRDAIELWTHHTRVAAVGLARGVMTDLVHNALGALARHADHHSVRISVPSADLLVGLVPTFAGALRASAVDADRITLAVPVELAVDPDLLPVIVHLRTMGLQIDIVGLNALTATLHRVSDTAADAPALPPTQEQAAGAWVTSILELL